MFLQDINARVTEFLSRLPEKVRAELKPVDREKLGVELLLHISKDTAIQEFSPVISRRTLELEDRSVPRISTAPSLAGCLIGYQSYLSDFLNRPTVTNVKGGVKVSSRFKGGWIIYGLPYDVAFKPSPKLLPDVLDTDEHWLVTLDENSVTYAPTRLGKVFFNEVRYRAAAGGPKVEVEMMVEVLTDTPVIFDHRNVLRRGYWKVFAVGLETGERWNKLPKVEVSAITLAEYYSAKRLTASLLSYDELAPKSSSW